MLRNNYSSGRILYAVADGSIAASEKAINTRAIACATVAGYTAAFGTFIFSLCIALGPATIYDTHTAVEIPRSARCLRVSRHADYASVWIPVGSPARSAELLLRLDKVFPMAESRRALRLRSTIVSQSRSRMCNTSSHTCVDIVQVGREGSEQTEYEFAAFDYVPSSSDYSISGAYLNLQGELALVAGNDYHLTPTLFCWSSHEDDSGPPPSGAARVDATSGTLLTSTSEGLGPALCNNSAVHLFPSCASLESQWLALSNRFLYEHAEKALEERRRVVERADSCANGDRQTAPYWLDCAASTPCGCQSAPSIPYRRLISRSVLTIKISSDGTGYITHAHASTLERIPALMTTESATWVAILRLLLMVFVAGVTFIRASQKTSNTTEIVLRSWRCAHGSFHAMMRVGDALLMENMMNAITGILALGSRVAVLVAMADVLDEDGQGVVLTSETAGIVISSVHFSLRHAAPLLELGTECETPIILFGGSMSLIDVTIAMLLTFDETPILGTRQSFGSVGRMLASVLLCINCVNIAIFATTACFATTTAQSRSKAYRALHGICAILWLGQSHCIALTLSAAFVRPFSFSLVLAHPGPWTTVRFAVAFGFLAASGPVRRATVVEIVHILIKGDQSQKRKAA